MKKRLALLLACTMALSLTACGGGKAADPTTTAAPATTAATEAAGEESKEAADTTAAEAAGGDMDALIEAAKAEGELTVYGSCEEEYLSAACQNFEKLYGIKTKYQRLSTSEVYTKISEEAGKPSADVWFGGTTDPYNEAVADGLLMQYDAINAKNLISDNYKDPTDCWYGIYKGILGFMVNTEELDRLGLEAPKTWDDLTKEEYKGLIMLSNPNTAGTAGTKRTAAMRRRQQRERRTDRRCWHDGSEQNREPQKALRQPCCRFTEEETRTRQNGGQGRRQTKEQQGDGEEIAVLP